MWNAFSSDVKFDLIVVFACGILAVILGAYLLRQYIRDIKRNVNEIKIIQNEGEYNISPDEEGKASFVVVAGGKATRITLKRKD